MFTSENYRRVTLRMTKTPLFTETHVLFYLYFLRAFGTLKHREIDENSHRSFAVPMLRWVSRLWYCDVTQTPTVTAFWVIVLITVLIVPRVSSRRRQVGYHSLIIESHSRRIHWLPCKKPHFINFWHMSSWSKLCENTLLQNDGKFKYVFIYPLKISERR